MTPPNNDQKWVKPEGMNDETWKIALASVKAEKIKRERILNTKSTTKQLMLYLVDDEYTSKKGDTVKTPKLSFTRLAGDINLVLAGNKHQLKAEGNDFHRMITFKANGQKGESIEELTTMINDILG